ncbi:unnamed protein product [Angiostrongylus costaricensis]|uniref:DAGKa domain-containing protein n=1 Tax=Angiostrongylus costaricensis TaxID=334426 RepID=A0A0R3Q1J5_ANGCS|nr:unnamed protein product [Angiostrongylus costaricensis]
MHALPVAHPDPDFVGVRQQVSPFPSTLVLEKNNPSDAQNAGFGEKSRKKEDIISKVSGQRNAVNVPGLVLIDDSGDENEDEKKDEDVEVDHRAVMWPSVKVRARTIRLEYSVTSQLSKGLAGGLDSYRHLMIGGRRKKEELWTKLYKMKRCEALKEKERMVAVRCVIPCEEGFDADSGVSGSKAPDQLKNLSMEVKSDVDKLLVCNNVVGYGLMAIL